VNLYTARVCLFVGLFWVDSFLALRRAVILGSQTEAHCVTAESVFTLLWLAYFICVSLTGQLYLSMFDRLCFCVCLACCVSLICVSCRTVKRKRVGLFFSLKGNSFSTLNEFRFMKVHLLIQIDQALQISHCMFWSKQIRQKTCNTDVCTDLNELKLNGYSTFFGNRLILQLPQSWVLPFSNPFSRFSDI